MSLGELTDQLCDLTRYWNDHEDVPKSQQAKCREIGKQLHAAGGYRFMTDAYYHAKSRNRFASTVQAYWDGIGDWRW